MAVAFGSFLKSLTARATTGATPASAPGAQGGSPRRGEGPAIRPDGRAGAVQKGVSARLLAGSGTPSTISLDALSVPEVPTTFGYTTRYAHPLAELAAQMGTTPAALCAANGWPANQGVIPAGTTIRVPDTPATRERAAMYGQPVADTGTASPASAAAASDPNAYFMTQSYDPTWNPNGPQLSEDCGPTSLAMALRAAGIAPPGVSVPTDASGNEAFIAATRQAMLPGSDSGTPTDATDVYNGAIASGANAAYVNSPAEVEAAVASGKQVVLAGDPVAYSARFPDMSSYDGGHFILVTAVVGSGANKRYLINDPLSHTGSVAITQQELETYMGYNGWNSGVAVWGSTPAEAPTPDASFPLTAEQVAAAIDAPVENVQKYLPYIEQAMQEAGMTDPREVIAVLATIKAENWNFAPMTENSDGSAYEGRTDLGNTQPGDGARFIGRGFIQITGRGNYQQYGDELGIDLVDHPELANDPAIAAKILVQYFKDNGVDKAAENGDWRQVRYLVNGGYNGWDVFSAAVDGLTAALGNG